MRVPILIALALALASCGKHEQAGNNQAADESLTAQNIVSNDVTAIDAVTGDAANMAADVDVNFTNDEIAQTANSPEPRGPQTPRTPRTPRPGKPPLETPTPATAATNNAE